MIPQSVSPDTVEISPHFRAIIIERIQRLEQGADFDESQLSQLHHQDHIRRQRLLVAAQRAEALRMRLFLDRCGTRRPQSITAL